MCSLVKQRTQEKVRMLTPVWDVLSVEHSSEFEVEKFDVYQSGVRQAQGDCGSPPT